MTTDVEFVVMPTGKRTHWTCETVPRVDEYVTLGKDGSGYVKHVTWHFADERGIPSKHRYVSVHLGALEKTESTED